jgi:hypothetical protein
LTAVYQNIGIREDVDLAGFENLPGLGQRPHSGGLLSPPFCGRMVVEGKSGTMVPMVPGLAQKIERLREASGVRVEELLQALREERERYIRKRMNHRNRPRVFEEVSVLVTFSLQY